MARWMTGWMILLLLLTLAACSDDGDNADPDGDTDGDAAFPDGDEDEDGDADGDSDPDGDSDGDVEADGDDDAPACVLPEGVLVDEPDLQQKKFALSMFHYNIQYVAGGLVTTVDGELNGFYNEASLEWTDEKLQDWIITESFEPVLDLYMAHPAWRATFEMQAMMLEAIAERFPAIYEKFRQATHSGQIEVVSFHYSAQLFLAFPAFDLTRSVEYTKEIFEKYCIPLSTVVFNQEGQAGEGKHGFMADNGYEISVFPKNLFKYVREGDLFQPYYKNRGVDVIVGPGSLDPAGGIEVNWTFFDDGELLSTPADPYFAPFTEADFEKVAEYEQKLTDLENQGYKVTSITDYVSHLKAQSVPQPDLPPVLDGTWQPTSTSSILRWMGGRSAAPNNYHERDSYIRSQNYKARTRLHAAEILYRAAADAGVSAEGADEETFRHLWRILFEAEVTDATGITPWIGEYNYADGRNEEILEATDAMFPALLTALGWPYASVNLESGEAARLEGVPSYEAPDEVDPPLTVTVDAPTRQVATRWTTYDSKTYDYLLTFGPCGEPDGTDAAKARVAVRFPRAWDKVVYSPGLLDDETVEYDYADFSFQKGEVYLPLANGLIGLGDDWWVVKDCESVHLAARVPVTDAEPVIEFVDETAEPAHETTYRFRIFHGSREDALALARRTNTHPMLYVTPEGVYRL